MSKNRQPDVRVPPVERVWVDLDPSLNARVRAVARRLGISRDEVLRRALGQYCAQTTPPSARVEAWTTPRAVNQHPDPLAEVERFGRTLGRVADAARRHLNE